MNPTLSENQVFFAYRTGLPQIRRGDIVAFQVGPNRKVFWFKRVVGLPGDTVSMLNGDVILNGRKVERQSIGAEPPNPTNENASGSNPWVRESEGAAFGLTTKRPGDDTVIRYVEQFPGEATAHHLYVMGDNRHDSMDSRASTWPRTQSGGVVLFASVFGVVDMDSVSPGPNCQVELLKVDSLDE